jgi:general stress protein 26
MGSSLAKEASKGDPGKAQAGKAIEATAAPGDTHPEFEEGMACADCHEVTVDAGTVATEAWIHKDYMGFSAGKGLETNEETKKHFLDAVGRKKQKKTYILATSINNVPLATTIEYAVDPDTMIMYGFSEKNTEKLFHIRANPRISLAWHKEFTDFGTLLCVQIRGTVETIDDPSKFDEGFNVYPYEYGADVFKMPLPQWREQMKQMMTMTKITVDEIIISDAQYSKEKGVRIHQVWKRQK